MAAELRYQPHAKHKPPKGYGTLCQKSVSDDHARELLDESVPHPANGPPKSRFAICGMAVFKGFSYSTAEGVEIWHGFPIEGQAVPAHVVKTWLRNERITNVIAGRLRRQSAPPEHCACSA